MASQGKEWQLTGLERVQLQQAYKRTAKPKPLSWQSIVSQTWSEVPRAAVGRTPNTEFFNQDSTPEPVVPSFMAVMGSAMGQWARSAYDRIEEQAQGFEDVPNYRITEQELDSISKQINLSSERAQQLQGLTSPDAVNWRVKRYIDEDFREQTQQHSTLATLAGSVIDVDLALGAVGKVAGGSKLLQGATKLERAAVGAGTVLAANTAFDLATSEHDTRSTAQKFLDAIVLGSASAIGGVAADAAKLERTSTKGGKTLRSAVTDSIQERRVMAPEVPESAIAKEAVVAKAETKIGSRALPAVADTEGVTKSIKPITKPITKPVVHELDDVATLVDAPLSSVQAYAKTQRAIWATQDTLKQIQAALPVQAKVVETAVPKAIDNPTFKQAADTFIQKLESVVPEATRKHNPVYSKVQEAIQSGTFTADIGRQLQKALPSEPMRKELKEAARTFLQHQGSVKRQTTAAVNTEAKAIQKATAYNVPALSQARKEQLQKELREELLELQAQQHRMQRELETGANLESSGAKDAESATDSTALELTENLSTEAADMQRTSRLPMHERPAPTTELSAIQRRAEYSNLSAKQYMSTTDKLMFLGKDLPAESFQKLNRLFSDPSFNNPDNAITHASLLSRHGEWRLNALDDALGRAARDYYGGSGRFQGALNPFVQPRQNRALRAAMKDLSDLRLKLYQMERQAESLGTTLDLPKLIQDMAPNKGIAEAMQAYVDSGFSRFYAQQMKRNGLLPEDFSEGLGTYMPLQWSYTAMRKAFDEGLPEEVLARFIGNDVLERFPDLAKYGRSAELIGKRFIQTQKTAMQSTEHIPVGATRDFIADILLNQGVEQNRINAIVDAIMHKQTQKGHKNLRTRNAWDFGKQFMYNGKAYSLMDFVDTDVMTQLQSYNRQMAHLNGLGHYGFTKADVDSLFTEVLNNLPAGVSPQEARDFLKLSKQQLLGQAVGENTPTLLRSASTAASSMVLQNAGINAIADIGNSFQRLGFMRTAKHALKNIPALFSAISKYTPEEAMRLRDVLSGASTAHERIKYFVTHFEDNYGVPMHGLHGYVARAGQSIMHLNTSEAIRRWLVHANASAYEEAVVEAAKGSKVHRKLLLRTGATEQDFQRIMQEHAKHGMQIQNWDADVSLRMQQLMINAMDDLALTVKAGEAPAFLEQTATGKVLFPFMRYAMAGHQKLLRKTYNQDGVFGVGVMLMYQGMLAPVLAAVKNITNAQEWDKDIVNNSIQMAPALGYFGIAMDGVLNSQNSRGAAVFSPLTKMNQLFRKVQNPDTELQVQDITDATPLLGLTIVNQGFGVLRALEED